MFFILSLFWFVRTAKIVLFWIYLWQLKEYHIGRFLDHFRTHKGKKLIFHPLKLSKIILIGLLLLSILKGEVDLIFSLILILFLIYFIESLFTFKSFFGKKLKFPVLTKKTGLLIFIGLIITILFPFVLFLIIKNIFWFAFCLLVFDVFTPKITSLIVLSFQPLVVLVRNQVLKKAKKKKEGFKNLLVIGITGSYGKTSAKEFLFEILSKKFKVLKTKEHQNSEIGISQCILNDLKPKHEIFIAEIGAYNRGKIKQVCDVIKPKIGILTGINEQHLATFKSQENIVKAKFELIKSLPPDGMAIFNGDNKFCQRLYKKTRLKKKIVFSGQSKIPKTEVNSDLWAKDIKIGKEEVSFKVFSKDKSSAEFKVKLLGTQNIENILLAAAVAKGLGMSLKEIARACQKIKPEQGGIQFKKEKNGLNIIDSTYSANPAGVISHLDYLKIWRGKKIVVMPCLIELGKASKEVHKRIGEKIGEVCDLAIITTKDRFKEIKEGAKMKEESLLFLEKPGEIIEKIKELSKEGDVVLLESRVPKDLINRLTK